MTQNNGKIKDICKEAKEKIEQENIGDFRKCTVCGKCAGSCSPEIRARMDLAPWKIVYLLTLEDEKIESALASETIQLCVDCSACVSRCPMGINMPKMMEILRTIVKKYSSDILDIKKIPENVLKEMPQMGIIDACKKFTK